MYIANEFTRMSTYNSFKQRPDCNFQTFWLGFTDWWAELYLSPEQKSARSYAAPKAHKKLQWLLLGALLLGAPVFAAFLAPLVANTMSAAGTHAVARSSEVLAVVIGLALVVGVPLWAALKLRRFFKEMCQRGQDIQAGLRTHARYL